MPQPAARFGDTPINASNDDVIQRHGVVESLGQLLRDPALDTPLTIGIFGDWGSGKTSVMRLLQEQLGERYSSIWFNAWHFAHQREALWRALLLAIVEDLREHVGSAEISSEEKALQIQDLERATVALYRSQEYEDQGDLQLNWKAALPLVLQSALALVPAAPQILEALQKLAGGSEDERHLFERESVTTYREQIMSLEQFQHVIRELIKRRYSNQTGKRLCIFVDDLDRCLPQAALEALEALKVFLDVPNCIFVVGVDRRVITAGIESRYKDAGELATYSASDYIEKLIQIPFSLPPLSETQILALIDSWNAAHGDFDLSPTVRNIIATGVARNPRKVKRTLNLLWLVQTLNSRHEALSVENVERLAKLTVLQTSYEKDYAIASRDARALKALEAKVLRPQGPTNTDTDRSGEQSPLRSVLALGARFGDISDDAVLRLLSAVDAG